MFLQRKVLSDHKRLICKQILPPLWYVHYKSLPILYLRITKIAISLFIFFFFPPSLCVLLQLRLHRMLIKYYVCVCVCNHFFLYYYKPFTSSSHRYSSHRRISSLQCTCRNTHSHWFIEKYLSRELIVRSHSKS